MGCSCSRSGESSSLKQELCVLSNHLAHLGEFSRTHLLSCMHNPIRTITAVQTTCYHTTRNIYQAPKRKTNQTGRLIKKNSKALASLTWSVAKRKHNSPRGRWEHYNSNQCSKLGKQMHKG